MPDTGLAPLKSIDIVNTLARSLSNAAKIEQNSSKLAIYWRIASLKIKNLTNFPGFAIVGPSGSGKSTIMDAMKDMDPDSAQVFSCIRLSTAEARDKLADTYERVAFCEEFDQLSDPSSAYVFFHSRTERKLSNLSLKRQTLKDGPYERMNLDVFGATVVHSRNPLTDPAIISRYITIYTSHRAGPYGVFVCDDEVSLIAKSIELRDEIRREGGRTESTWGPILQVAEKLGDNDWLAWAYQHIAFLQEGLIEAAAYDTMPLVLSRIIEIVADREADILSSDVGVWDRININLDISEYLRRNGQQQINAWMVANAIRTLGLKTARIGGRNWLLPTPVLLLLACQRLSFEDEWIEKLKERAHAIVLPVWH